MSTRNAVTVCRQLSKQQEISFHLTRVFRFFEKPGAFPKVKFPKISNLSNARWNSLAILALLAFILLPERRDSLLDIWKFISYAWSDHWFTDQMYNADDYQKP